jgi:hypothetical protein
MTKQKATISRRVVGLSPSFYFLQHLKISLPCFSQGYGFTGALLVAGVTFYLAKRSIAERRKAELDEYRACKLSAILRLV